MASIDRLLRLPRVEDISGLRKSKLYDLIASGKFPAPVRIAGTRAVGWRESELSKWVDAQTERVEVRMIRTRADLDKAGR